MNGPRSYDVILPPTSLGVSQRAYEAFDPHESDRTLSLTVLGHHEVPAPTEETVEMTVQRITENQDGSRAILGRSALQGLVVVETSADPNEKATVTIVR